MKVGNVESIIVPSNQIALWEDNPRGIMKPDYERLKYQINSLKIYKPLVCCKVSQAKKFIKQKFNGKHKYLTLGGNMRFRAYTERGDKNCWISVVNVRSKKEMVEYALSDNDRAGFYETDKLAELTYAIRKDIDLKQFKVDTKLPTVDLGDVLGLYIEGPELPRKPVLVPPETYNGFILTVKIPSENFDPIKKVLDQWKEKYGIEVEVA